MHYQAGFDINSEYLQIYRGRRNRVLGQLDMDRKVSDQFLAEVDSYYEAQDLNEPWFKPAKKQEQGPNDKPKPRFKDIQREKAAKVTKPLSDYKLPDGIDVEELLKSLADVKLNSNGMKAGPSTGKKGSKS